MCYVYYLESTLEVPVFSYLNQMTISIKSLTSNLCCTVFPQELECGCSEKESCLLEAGKGALNLEKVVFLLGKVSLKGSENSESSYQEGKFSWRTLQNVW